jgi:hypothetical protein
MATGLKVPAQPYEFNFEPATTALLVIDMIKAQGGIVGWVSTSDELLKVLAGG